VLPHRSKDETFILFASISPYPEPEALRALRDLIAYLCGARPNIRHGLLGLVADLEGFLLDLLTGFCP
jgi:hypothetical protein